jgi:TolB protein
VLVSAAVLLALAAPAQAAFPGANGRIAYSVRHATAPYQIFTAKPDGSDERLLVSGGFLSWSADGKKIAYDGSGIDYINADGTGPSIGIGGGNYPAWSPDGTKIVGMFLGGDFDLHVVSLPYLEHTLLAPNREFDGQPEWSPDGTKIAFTSVRSFGQQQSDIYTVDPGNTTPPVNLTNHPAFDQYPSWSPDGRKLAFSSEREGNIDIYVMNADGTAQTRLTTDVAEDYRPVWSPDGRKILFLSKRDGGSFSSNSVLYVMNADGTAQTRITSTDRDIQDEDWQPVPGPRRTDYKNAAQFCKAERDFWGDQFASRYGGGANAYGKCVSGNK